MSHFEKTLILILVSGLQGMVLTGLFTAPYLCTYKVRRYSEVELTAMSDRFRGIGQKAAANLVWVLVAVAICVLAALAATDAGSGGDGYLGLVAFVMGIMLIGFIQASFALTTGTIPSLSLRRFGWEYIYGNGSEVKKGALMQVGVTFLVPLTLLLRWYVEVAL